ncbi:MAG: hypothetical protein ACO31I_02490 [Prochlorotrichaceae cyanobacterium]
MVIIVLTLPLDCPLREACPDDRRLLSVRMSIPENALFLACFDR